jgi:hypothetical protein
LRDGDPSQAATACIGIAPGSPRTLRQETPADERRCFAAASYGFPRLDARLARTNLLGVTYRCAHCGEVIGGREPSVVVQSREMGPGKHTAQPGCEHLAKWHYHLVCHEALRSARQPHSDKP